MKSGTSQKGPTLHFVNATCHLFFHASTFGELNCRRRDDVPSNGKKMRSRHKSDFPLQSARFCSYLIGGIFYSACVLVTGTVHNSSAFFFSSMASSVIETPTMFLKSISLHGNLSLSLPATPEQQHSPAYCDIINASLSTFSKERGCNLPELHSDWCV